jgi:hypothetical protein
MQLSKLEKLAVALIEALADPDIDLALRKALRETYDRVEQSICAPQSDQAKTSDVH